MGFFCDILLMNISVYKMSKLDGLHYNRYCYDKGINSDIWFISTNVQKKLM